MKQTLVGFHQFSSCPTCRFAKTEGEIRQRDVPEGTSLGVSCLETPKHTLLLLNDGMGGFSIERDTK